MQILISEIKIKKRVRKDMGDLEPLKASLTQYGLLNPITINSQYELVAGHRRLEAARALGWTEIEAVMVDTKDKVTLLELELEENIQRKAFTETELMEGYEALEKLKNPGFFVKTWEKIKGLFRKAFDVNEAKKQEKLKTNGFLAILTAVGITFIVLGAVLFSKGIITGALHFFMDVFGFLVFVVGVFYTVKFFIGFRARTKRDD